ncbi:Phytochelatin-domain-containing protein [Ascobolus immersus RN42]|uniref:glutathione gamma-glutamylcysteinyltransferase n=1 Tax=Ascobolus immersus RN42 TaxID=1160509 RepID=A0A3N4IJ47_ASCIM|nr:Phytochelatin-domain-containing protein [Ascobolus immersus RN42]
MTPRIADASFYMRTLPTNLLVGYETKEGKQLFRKALDEGGLEAFFPLSQQFLTQEEPAYCGIGTLCMILNALKVDPAKTWRKPWRWFTQEMLDCCRPLEDVKKKGITLAEFACLARCNGLDATTRFANKITFEEFHEDVKKSASSEDSFIAVSYSRASLGQTGSGHFSPIGGYCSDKGGMVLILDVARFKYPSYWVPIQRLFESLQPIDAETGQPRGYSILRKSKLGSSTPSSLFRLNLQKGKWEAFVQNVKQYAQEIGELPVEQFLEELAKKINFCPVLTRELEVEASVPDKEITPDSPKNNLSVEYYVATEELIDALAAYSRLYQTFKNDKEEGAQWTVFFLALARLRPFFTVLPFKLKEDLDKLADEDCRNPVISREVSFIRTQILSLQACCNEEGETCKSAACCKSKVDIAVREK